jgi:hypothetical protein
MPAIASLEELKMVRRDFRSMFLVVTPNALRLTIYGNILTLCSMRSALCCMKMAQDRLEECLQAMPSGTHSGTIES